MMSSSQRHSVSWRAKEPTWCALPQQLERAAQGVGGMGVVHHDAEELTLAHLLEPARRVRAAEHNVYLALANWSGQWRNIRANGNSGIFSPTYSTYPWPEVIADEGEPALTMMTIDTREQRTGRRSSTHPLSYAPGDVAGSLTGELAYDIRDTIPGNVVRSKPRLRKRMPFWYLDLVT